MENITVSINNEVHSFPHNSFLKASGSNLTIGEPGYDCNTGKLSQQLLHCQIKLPDWIELKLGYVKTYPAEYYNMLAIRRPRIDCSDAGAAIYKDSEGRKVLIVCL